MTTKKKKNKSKNKDKITDQERAQEAFNALTADPVRLMQMLALSVTNNANNQTNKNSNIKLEPCPTKKICSLDAWLSEVELWDSSNNVGDPATLNTKKYLALMESIRNAEDEELKSTGNVEFMENQEFDKKAENGSNGMIQKLKDKLGDSDLEKSLTA